MMYSISRKDLHPILFQAIVKMPIRGEYNSIKFTVLDFEITLVYKVDAEDAYVAGGDKYGEDLYENLIIGIEPLWLTVYQDGLVIHIDTNTHIMIMEEFKIHTRKYINTKYSY